MAYVILDKISATAHVESIVSATDLLNGQFVELGALQSDGEARLVEAGADKAKKLAFHVSNGLVYGDRENELDFVLKAGKTGRAYVLQEGDIISITVADVANTPVVGANVKPTATGFEVDPLVLDGIRGEIIAFDYDAIAGKMAVIRISI